MNRAIILFLFLKVTVSFAQNPCVANLVPLDLQLSAVNYRIEGGVTLSRYLGKIEESVKSADPNAKLVLLPELTSVDRFDFSLPESTIPSQIRNYTDDYNKVLSLLKKLSMANYKYIVVGGIFREQNANIYNTAVMVTPTGQVFTQDKIFLTPDEKDWGMQPGHKLNIINTPIGKIVILICYDSEFPVLSQLLVRAKPDLLLVPSMTDEAGFYRVRWSAQARAIEHKAFILTCGVTGCPSPGWEFYARAAVIAPSDSKFSGVLSEDPQAVSTVISISKLREARELNEPYPAKDQWIKKRHIKIVEVSEDIP